MASVRNIYLEMSGRVHNYFQSFFSNPPPGYRFYSKDQFDNMRLSKGVVSAYEKWGKPIQMNSGLPVKLAKSVGAILDRPPEGTDMVLTNGLLDFRDEKWAVIIEHALASLMGVPYDIRMIHPIVERSLAGKNCKAAIAFFKASLNSMNSTYDCSSFRDKLRLVPLAAPLVPRNIRKRNETTTIVLLGSINYTDETVFYIRGGHIAIDSFLRVAAEFPDVNFVLRTVVPARYELICKHHNNIIIRDKPMNSEEYNNLLWNADICLVPFFDTPWMTFLDAMNHEVPIITTNLHANAEVVADGEWGLVCEVPSAFRSIIGNYNVPSRRAYREIHDNWFYNYQAISVQLASALRSLLRNESLRRELGRNGRAQLERSGQFSIERRNQILKEVLDECFET